MATPGRPLDKGTRDRIERLLREDFSYRQIAALAGVCKQTVQNIADELYGKKPRALAK